MDKCSEWMSAANGWVQRMDECFNNIINIPNTFIIKIRNIKAKNLKDIANYYIIKSNIIINEVS
jgi:hypothetical protein